MLISYQGTAKHKFKPHSRRPKAKDYANASVGLFRNAGFTERSLPNLLVPGVTHRKWRPAVASCGSLPAIALCALIYPSSRRRSTSHAL
jgi:hypothetical protein